MGVNILPRLAATVIRATAKHSRFRWLAISSIIMPRGTKVMRATSLVISILPTKHRNTRVAIRPRTDPTRESTRAATYWRNCSSLSPSTSSIRQNRVIRVLKSM